jgi:hypothetical protein
MENHSESTKTGSLPSVRHSSLAVRASYRCRTGLHGVNGLGPAGKSLVLRVLPEDRWLEMRLESESSRMVSEMACIRSVP